MSRPKSAAARFDEAIAVAEAAKRKLAELHASRNRALLNDDDVGAMKLAAEIDLAEQTTRGAADKVELLKIEAEREAHERRARERIKLIERIESKLAARDKVGAELGETLRKADALFCELVKRSGEVRTSWPWAHSDFLAALLGDQSIVQAVEHELYRCGARPFIGGGMDRNVAPSFPGGRCPRIELAGMPDQVPPLGDVLKDATRRAGEIMRTGRTTGNIDVATVPAPAALSGTDTRTDAERKLAVLLQKQLTLSEDVSPAGEERYLACVDKIAKLQGEIDAFKALANGGAQ